MIGRRVIRSFVRCYVVSKSTLDGTKPPHLYRFRLSAPASLVWRQAIIATEMMKREFFRDNNNFKWSIKVGLIFVEFINIHNCIFLIICRATATEQQGYCILVNVQSRPQTSSSFRDRINLTGAVMYVYNKIKSRGIFMKDGKIVTETPPKCTPLEIEGYVQK